MPYFSIILPIYNVEAYLPRCIRSVLEQSFTDYELILVNDGSTDGCKAICDEMAQQYSCIRVLHKENGGLSSARNAGLDMARGQYIWWVDSDDWIAPDSLEKLYSLTCKDHPQVVKFHYRYKDCDIISAAPAGLYETRRQIEKLQTLAFGSTSKFVLSACTHLYETTFLRKNGLRFVSERQVASEDYLFNLQVMICIEKLCVTEDVLYRYEVREGSLTQRYKPQLIEKYACLYGLLVAFCWERQLLDQYKGRINGFFLNLFYGTCLQNSYHLPPADLAGQERKYVKKWLKSDVFRLAYKQYDRLNFSRKRRMQFWLMRWGGEPVLYWVFVKKPKCKKDISNEDKTET